jgi:group I intron endonuclease
MFQVYTIKNKLNGNIYVGCTEVGLELRFERHIKSMNKGSDCSLHQAIREFGQDNFEINVIEEYSTKEEMFKGEVKYIKELDTYKTPHGYNDTKGGEGGDTNGGKTFDDEWRLNMSKSITGKPRKSTRKYSDKIEREICRQYVEDNRTIHWLAKELKTHRSLIIAVLDRGNVVRRESNHTGHKNFRNKFSPEIEKEICDLFLAGGVSRSDLGRTYNSKVNVITAILERYDIVIGNKNVENIPTKIDNGNYKPIVLSEVVGKDFASKANKAGRKLSFEEAETIRKEYATGGVSQKELSVRYQVPESCISSIIRNKTYIK